MITGGTSGIGLATARALSAQGVDVLLLGRDARRGRDAVDALASGAGRASFVAADVRDSKQVASAFADADRTFGRVDILFNNAGTDAVGPIDVIDEDGWDTCIDTNLKGAFLASREAIPRMRAVGGGVIVNNASNAGLLARARDPVYCASKAGLIMLTRAMALAHAADRIRVNAVCPGPVSGAMIDRAIAKTPDPAVELAATISAAPLAAAVGRLIAPEEVAAAVLYFCSDLAAMITGAVLAVDAGKSAGIPR